MRRRLALGLILAAATSLVSCSPGGPTSASDRDLVTTFFDPSAPFGSIRSYAMPDEVISREDSEAISQEAEDTILREVARNMAALGYRRELNPEENGADVVVLVGVNQQTTVNWWVSWDWWGGWGGWPGWGGWGPRFGFGWGFSYPWVTVTAYTTGAVFIDMVDPNLADVSNEEIPAVWGAGLSGLVTRDEEFNQGRTVQAIEQAFRQSPYLGAVAR